MKEYQKNSLLPFSPTESNEGLTKRQYISALCMQGLMANTNYGHDAQLDDMAFSCVQAADNLLAQLSDEELGEDDI